MEFKRGEQIAYIPTHAEGNVDHPDTEFGFVTKDSGDKGVFCRYFYKNGTLRTVSCSELTPREKLVFKHSRNQSGVRRWLQFLKYPDEE
ncbi:hypothetical protein MUP95_10450 [bacterium]|nr:hypothetical protein [bacterium]